MRPEKKYLVEEAGSHLDKSSYVFLTDYHGITVEQTETLRDRLAEHKAEFHVVKNSALNVAARDRDYPDLREWLNGPTAIVVGGDEAPAVMKKLQTFFKETEKVDAKIGVLDNKLLSKDDLKALADLPSLDLMQAKLLGLLNTPAQQFVRVINATPQGLVTVLNARKEQLEN